MLYFVYTDFTFGLNLPLEFQWLPLPSSLLSNDVACILPSREQCIGLQAAKTDFFIVQAKRMISNLYERLYAYLEVFKSR